MASLGEKMLRDEVIKQWDAWLTDKPSGDLLAFYQKRLAAFYERSDLAKSSVRKRRQTATSPWRKPM